MDGSQTPSLTCANTINLLAALAGPLFLDFPLALGIRNEIGPVLIPPLVEGQSVLEPPWGFSTDYQRWPSQERRKTTGQQVFSFVCLFIYFARALMLALLGHIKDG